MSFDSKNFASAVAISRKRYLLKRAAAELAARRRNLQRFRVPIKQRIKQHPVVFGISMLMLTGFAAGGVAFQNGYFESSQAVSAPVAINKPIVQAHAPVVAPVTIEPVKPVPLIVAGPVLIKVVPVKEPPQKSNAKPIIKQGITTPSPKETPALIAPKADASGVSKPQENLQRAKDLKETNELGFKVSLGYKVVGIPADGVVMIKKDGETVQQMIKVGGRFPDGEELRSATSASKQIETNARKYITQ